MQNSVICVAIANIFLQNSSYAMHQHEHMDTISDILPIPLPSQIIRLWFSSGSSRTSLCISLLL